MNFSLTDEQLLIQQSAESFVSSVSTSEEVRQSMNSELGYNAEHWQHIQKQLGWVLTHIPEIYDGLGLGYVELALLLEKMGEYLFNSPFFSTVVLGVNSLLVAANKQQQLRYFQRIIEGSHCSLAFAGSGRHHGIESVQTRFTEQDDGVVLNGKAVSVIDGHHADFLIVAASNSDDSKQLGLFIAHREDGYQSQPIPTLDQTRKLADIGFGNVFIASEQILNINANQQLADILALASIGLAAEQMGIANKVLAMSVDYISERKQFGRVVGSFQAMKHKAADMMLKAESARSAVFYAACIADEYLAKGALADELAEASHIALSYCSDSCFYNAGSAIQMFGGVGFTWEYDLHLYFKRAKASQHLFGDSHYHRQQLANLLLAYRLDESSERENLCD